MSVESFRQILVDLSQKKLTAEQACTALAELVSQDPAQADNYVNLLNQLYAKRKLPVALYSQLRDSVMNPDAAPGSDVDPLAALDAADSAPPAANDDAGKTQFRMPTPPAAPPPDGPGETQFRPGTKPPTGAPSQTPSLTGQSMGTAGSNWSSPSAWTGVDGPGSEPGAPIGVGSVIKDRFVLEELIGRGGMGMVFKARDLRKEEAQDREPHVALKILNEEFKRHPESLKALQRESRKAQALAHPNIVNVYDFDRDGGTVFMTMELLEGMPLDILIRENRGTGMPWKEALPLIKGMSLALERAHKSHIIHSDFKPGNCFLTNNGVVKVFDFGIARAAKRTGDLKGEETMFDAGTLGALTPAYATCEMIDGEEPDQRDDVYALGCTIYELLSGRHPYDKLSAADATAKKMVPKPIKGLSRSRFKALCKSLALTRSKRTRSAFALLEELNPRNNTKYMAVGVGVLAVVLLASAALIFVPQYLYKQRLESIATLLQTETFDEVETAIALFDDIEAGDRQVLLSTYGEQIIATFDRQIGESFNRDADRFDYPKARSVLDRLLELYPDSSRVDTINDQVEDDRSEVQAQLSAEYEALIATGTILPSDTRDVFDVLDTARALDPADELLQDARLPQALAAKARVAAETQDFDQARRYLDVGLDLSPDDLELINVRDEVTAASAAVERAQQIESLERALAPLLANDTTLGDYTAETDVLRDLSMLQPDNSSLATARTRIERLLTRAVKDDVQAREWANASARLERFDGIVSPAFVDAQSGVVDDGRRAFEGIIETLIARVDAAIAAGNLETPASGSALGEFAKLDAAGADAETLSAARDRIATGFIDASRAARFKQDWETARQLAARVEALSPSAPVMASANEEMSKIANQETLAVQEVRARELAGLQKRFDDRLALDTIGKADIDAAMRVLGELQSGFSDDAAATRFVAGARERLAGRIDTQALALARNQRWQDAANLISAGQQALGDSTALAQTATQVAKLQREQASEQAASRIQSGEEELAGLLSSAALDPTWQDEFDRQVAALEALEPGNRFAAEARERAAALYLKEAAELSAASRWSAAEQKLRQAQALAPRLDAVVAQTALFESGRQAFEQDQQALRLAADVKGKRDRFTRELSAGRVDQAESLFKELSQLLEADDPFLTRTGPRSLVNGYLAIAADNASKDRYTAAMGQLDLATPYGSTDARIDKARTQYEGQRAAYNAVSSGSASDIRALSGLLGTLQSVMSDYDGFAARLERALKRRIEDRARSNRRDAEALYAAARDPFPNLAITFATRQAATPTPAPAPTLAPAPVTTPARPPVSAPPPASTSRPRASQAKARACRISYAGGGKRRTCKDILPGDVSAPLLVVIPGVNGGPPFAMTRSEIPRSDYNLFCSESNQCAPQSGAANLPATGISAPQMQAFANWLSEQTGRQYSLPTLEQWRHAAQAGNGALNPNINCQIRGGGKNALGMGLVMFQVDYGGSDQANAWGLRQVVGNAEEVVRNGGNYLAAGGAFTDRRSDCTPTFSRPFSGPGDVTGFRLARDVDGS